MELLCRLRENKAGDEKSIDKKAKIYFTKKQLSIATVQNTVLDKRVPNVIYCSEVFGYTPRLK